MRPIWLYEQDERRVVEVFHELVTSEIHLKAMEWEGERA
jgi:hypothetical protein